MQLFTNSVQHKYNFFKNIPFKCDFLKGLATNGNKKNY